MGGGTVQPGVGGNNQVGGTGFGNGFGAGGFNAPDLYKPQDYTMSMQADGNTTGFRSKVPQALGSPPQNDVPPVSSVLDTGGAIPPQTSGRFPVNNTPELGVTQGGGLVQRAINKFKEGNLADYNNPIEGGGYSPPGSPIEGGGYSNQYYSEGGLIKDPLEGYDFKRGR